MGMSGIYQIVNTTNYKMYIGSAVNLLTRKKTHFGKLGSKAHPNKHLQASFNKYGKDSFAFKVLEVVSSPNDLLKREQFWIDLAKSEETQLYNKRLVAESNLGFKQSKETISKRVATNRLRGFNYGRGIPKSPKAVELMIAAHKGKPHPRKGDVYTRECKYGHQKTRYASGNNRCKTCRRNSMKFYNILNQYIIRGGC